MYNGAGMFILIITTITLTAIIIKSIIWFKISPWLAS